MTWSHNLKAQEAEGTEQRSSVISVLVETNEHMLYLKLLFRKLKKNCKTVFAPLWQRTIGKFDIQIAVIQHSSPTDVFGIRQPGLDVQDSCPVT